MYIEILKSISIENKYFSLYCRIIENSFKRKIKPSIYEKHHILPKSFKLGGEKDKCNIAILTPREHYIAHILLPKFLKENTHKYKMLTALMKFRCDTNIKNSTRYFNSHIYDFLKIEYSKYMKIYREESGANKRHSEFMKVQWMDESYKKLMSDKKQWFYKSEEHKQFLSKKALKEMQDPDRKASFVAAGFNAGKIIRDADPKAWVQKSLGSKEARTKAKKTHQSVEHREFCKQRELSKGKEVLSNIGKERQQKGVQKGIEKYGSEEAYWKAFSEINKGRVKIINDETGEVRAVKNPNFETDFIGFRLAKKQKVTAV